jgi:hypothetical protein
MKVTIFGSCVTRDVFDLAGKNDRVAHYFARCSVVSAVSGPLALQEEEIKLSSEFQRRAVFYDFNKSFKNGAWLSDSDWLAIDFIDERLPILKYSADGDDGGGACVTRSQEFVRGGLEAWGGGRFSSVNLSLKTRLWLDAVPEFVEIIKPLLRKRRVILHEAYFSAYYGKDGKTEPFVERAAWINTMNSVLARYYEKFKQLCGDDLHVIDLSGTEFHCADPEHRWGLSPEHYVCAYYEEVFRRMEDIIADAKHSVTLDVMGNHAINQVLDQTADQRNDATPKMKTVRIADGQAIFDDVAGAMSRGNNPGESKAYFENKSDYLVLCLLDAHIDASLLDIYDNRHSKRRNDVTGRKQFRKCLDEILRPIVLGYRKVVLISDQCDPAMIGSVSNWFAEECNAVVRNTVRASEVTIPLRNDDGILIPQENKYDSLGTLVADAIEIHYKRIPLFNVLAEVKGDKVIARIESDKFEGLDLYYSFYLMRYGKVHTRCPKYWMEESMWEFELTEPGIYTIQGFVKHQNPALDIESRRGYLSSLPFAYFPEETVKEYEDWKESYAKQDTVLGGGIDFFPYTGIFHDFAVISSTESVERLDPPETTSDWKFVKMEEYGKHKVYILTNGELAEDKGAKYLCSGYVLHDGAYRVLQSPGMLTSSHGLFNCVVAGETETIVYGDTFGMATLYEYRSKTTGIVSNRYQLLLDCLRRLGVCLEINEDLAYLKFFTDRIAMLNNNTGIECDIKGVNVVPFYATAKFGKTGLAVTGNVLMSALRECDVFHTEDYFRVFNKAKREISDNLRGAINMNKDIIVDLSGGLDTRLIYAAITEVDDSLIKYRINAKDVNNDLRCAIQLNALYGIPYDEFGVDIIPFDLARGDKIHRSVSNWRYFDLGVPVSHQVQGAHCISLPGVYGELSRNYFSGKYIGKQFDDLDTLSGLTSFILGDYCPNFHASNDLLEKLAEYLTFSFERQPIHGLNFSMNILLMYTLIRNPFHFGSSEMHSHLFGIPMISVLESESMFFANVMSAPLFNGEKFQFDLIAAFNPAVFNIEFEDDTNNKVLQRLARWLRYAPSKPEAINADLDISKWRTAEERRRKNNRNLKPLEQPQKNMNTEHRKAAFNCLHEAVKLFPAFEKRFGLALWYYVSHEASDANVRRNYNKLICLLDQYSMIKQSKNDADMREP